MNSSGRLLLIGCSQKKLLEPDMLPAMDRYDGPLFRILRKFRREHPAHVSEIDTRILSAKFGLLSANTTIPNYDLRMTKMQADSLRDQILGDLYQLISQNRYEDAFISLGRSYWYVFDGHEDMFLSTMNAVIATGSMGRRQSQLLQWLKKNLPDHGVSSVESRISNGKLFDFTRRRSATMKGIKISATLDEIFDLARKRLKTDRANAVRYHSWYVLVDETPVAPKWLMSQLTGLAVGDFHTGSARRVLELLGVEVRMV